RRNRLRKPEERRRPAIARPPENPHRDHNDRPGERNRRPPARRAPSDGLTPRPTAASWAGQGTGALKQRALRSLSAHSMKRKGGDRDPKGNSLWLLPSGPDQVGEAFARDL